MGFRMRKSMKVAPGVRLSVSKSGVGASVGGKGGRYSVHAPRSAQEARPASPRLVIARCALACPDAY